MSQFEPKDMTGTLFKNDRKEKDTHPNMTGSAVIDGRKVYISAWTKEGAKGRFQSLSFKWADEARAPEPERRGSMKDQLDDKVPF